MKKITKALGITLLAGSILVACNSEEDTETPNNGDNGTSDEQLEDDDNGVDEGTGDEGEDDSDENTESDEGDTGGGLGSDQEFGDQLDLGIGDTAQISSNQGAYEITIHSVKHEEEIEGNSSMFDSFIVVDLTVKNIGEATIDAYDPVNILDQTYSLDSSGSNDFSTDFESIDSISGELQPGEEVTGQAVFHIDTSEEQFIRVQPGLIAADGVYNDAVWTFTEDEME
ncbi:hypothetical protein AB990_20210 [Alkalihalobacillus pseudalcaliphilus]|nr:hypothetical protein AB990_20210 [Alkalihalobacillus pseudalcaliphilus]